jgi:hypothetical protein
MSDDDRKGPIQSRATVPVNPLFHSSDDDTAQVHPSREEIKDLIEKSRARAEQGVMDADTTTVMSRDAIIRNAARDRERGDSPQTIPMDAVLPVPPTQPLQVAQSPEDLDTTIEASYRIEEIETLHGIDHGVGTAYPENGTVEFVGQVDGLLRTSIPAELAQEVGLKPGDVVVVRVIKVQS